jgi:hypothetical protein
MDYGDTINSTPTALTFFSGEARVPELPVRRITTP